MDDDAIRRHIDTEHSRLVDRDEIEANQNRVDRKIEQILDTLVGPRAAFGVHAGDRIPEKGLERKVEHVEKEIGSLTEAIQRIESKLAEVQTTRLSTADRGLIWGTALVVAARTILGWLGVQVP